MEWSHVEEKEEEEEKDEEKEEEEKIKLVFSFQPLAIRREKIRSALTQGI
jgi:NACalpha-BTF3-like transcription factor